MTTNQIAYFKAKVEQQHYNMMDAETQRANRANEQLKYQSLVEENRANVAKETENTRHNTTTEGIQYSNLLEEQRHNVVSEQQQAFMNQVNAEYTTSKMLDQDWENYLNLKYGETERVMQEALNAPAIKTAATLTTTAIKRAEMNNMTQPAQQMINQYKAKATSTPAVGTTAYNEMQKYTVKQQTNNPSQNLKESVSKKATTVVQPSANPVSGIGKKVVNAITTLFKR